MTDNRVTVHSQPTVVASKLLAISQESANDTNNIMFPKDTAEDLNDVIYHMRYETVVAYMLLLATIVVLNVVILVSFIDI